LPVSKLIPGGWKIYTPAKRWRVNFFHEPMLVVAVVAHTDYCRACTVAF
jgi:hypothetical protein